MSDSSPELPNILFLVWDACRADYANRHAPTLSGLADSNVSFEDTVVPSPWSLPSHASIFSGLCPTEHGRHRADQSLDCPMAERLSEMGYTTVGISANGFASQRTGFSESFDEFHYTGGRDLYREGLDVSGAAQSLLRADESATELDALLRILRLILSHPHRLKSIANLLAVASGEAAMKAEVLQRIPHRLLAPDSGYCYDPRRNTATLESVLERDDGPYFIFLNYMDTHYPYKPRAKYQRKHLGQTLSHRELRRLNETVAAPRTFLERTATGEIRSEDVESVRDLYAGEVETLDDHLRRVLNALEHTGAREDTLLVITSDHGENLGEEDDTGHRRMGHEGSVSDAVLKIPLVVAHPQLDDRTVSETVSLKNVYGLLVNGVPDLLRSGGDNLDGLEPSDGPVVGQYPAVGGERLFEKHPDAPREALAYRISVDTVVAYNNDWKVVASSNGERWARENGTVVGYESAPDGLRSRCESDLSRLEGHREGGDRLSEAEISRLEALGYM